MFSVLPVTQVLRESSQVNSQQLSNSSCSLKCYDVSDNDVMCNSIYNLPDIPLNEYQCNVSYQMDSHESVDNTSVDLKLLVWNIQGLSDKLTSHGLLTKVSEFDIVLFLETMKLNTYNPSTGDFVFKHFQRKYQNFRARRPSGGIGVLIKSKLYDNKSVSIVKDTDFVVWLKIINKSSKDIYM